MAAHTDRKDDQFLTAGIPDAWFDGYSKLSSASQSFASRWLESCADQLQRNVDSWSELTTCKSTLEAAEIQQRWWQGTVDHLSAEAKAYQDLVSALSREAVSPLLKRKASR